MRGATLAETPGRHPDVYKSALGETQVARLIEGAAACCNRRVLEEPINSDAGSTINPLRCQF